MKLDKEGLPARAQDWLEADWLDLWNGINKIKAKIRARHRVQPNDPSSATRPDGGRRA